jgi:outer membrane protein assembly factor BamE (lipoprotein component of BamABCDE complex)
MIMEELKALQMEKKHKRNQVVKIRPEIKFGFVTNSWYYDNNGKRLNQQERYPPKSKRVVFLTNGI